MATVNARLDLLEKEQIKQERDNKYALELHKQENESAMAAMQAQIDGIRGEVQGFTPVLEGIKESLNILVGDKMERDVLAKERKDEEEKKPSTPWGKFKDKLIESLATLVSGGVIALVVWLAAEFLKQGGVK